MSKVTIVGKAFSQAVTAAVRARDAQLTEDANDQLSATAAAVEAAFAAVGLDLTKMSSDQKVTVDYTNYRDVRSIRTITPWGVDYGSTDWHPELGWLITCYDHDKKAARVFALSGIHSWNEQEVSVSTPTGEGEASRDRWLDWRGAVEGIEASVPVVIKALDQGEKLNSSKEATARSAIWMLGLDHVWEHVNALRSALAAKQAPAVAAALRKEADRLLERAVALAHPPQRGEWKLVPVEPTKEMLIATDDLAWSDQDKDLPLANARSVYAVMLRAAPLPPSESSGEES